MEFSLNVGETTFLTFELLGLLLNAYPLFPLGPYSSVYLDNIQPVSSLVIVQLYKIADWNYNKLMLSPAGCTLRGEVVATTGEGEAVLYSDVDLGLQDSIREQIPISKQKRHDIYQVVEK